MRVPVSLILVVSVLLGCATSHTADTIAADTKAIHTLVDQFASAFEIGDPDLFARCVTEDFVALAPSEPAIEGREAARARVAQDLMAMDVLSLRFDIVELQVAGAWAWARATSAAEVAPRDAEGVREIRGKTLWMFRRGVDGAWRIARDASSGDE